MKWLALPFRPLIIVAFVLTSTASSAQGEQKLANIGSFMLENGQVIRDCKIGYRTYGLLNADKSNAVLFPTWFGGRSGDLAQFIGQGMLLDTAGLFIVAVDALGNGVSSSPSNSKDQAGAAFPAFSVADMVVSQHKLLTDVLKIGHLRAVIGISMGGMQAFQWMVTYPTFVDRVISLAGTPKQTSQDLLLWKSQLRTIEDHRGSPDMVKKGMRAVARMHLLHLQTPAYHVARTKPEAVDKLLENQEREILNRDPEDWASQLVAMIGHDIYRSAGGTEEMAAKVIRSKALVVVVTADQMVNPAPSLRLAERIGAKTLRLTNDAGHLGLTPDFDRVTTAVRDFVYGRD